MKAVILAAGMGTRLRSLTANTPKCLLKVNGERIIENALEHLNRNGVETAVIVIGYLGNKVRECLGDQFQGIRLFYVENRLFNATNNIYSLWLAKEYLADDILLLEADIFFEVRVIERVCKHNYPDIIVVDEYQSFMNGTGIITERGIVTEIITEENEWSTVRSHPKLKTVNIYKFSKAFMETYFIPALGECIAQDYLDECYEFALARIVKFNAVQLITLSVAGLKWFEIDTAEDLRRAERVFGIENLELRPFLSNGT